MSRVDRVILRPHELDLQCNVNDNIVLLLFVNNSAHKKNNLRYKLVQCNETNLLPYLRGHFRVLTSYTSLCLFLTEFYNNFIRIFLISRSVSHNNVVSLKN